MNETWTKVLPSFLRTRLDGRPSLQKILANTGWLFADRIFSIAVGLFVGAWVARYLGPERFGLYNYVLAFVALFAPLSQLGLDSIVVREIVRDPSHKEQILGTTLILRFTSSVLALILTVSVISLLRPEDNLTRWLVAIIAGGMVFRAFDTINLWFQSQVQSKYTVWAKNGGIALVALVKVVLILAQAPLIAFAWAALAEIALGAVGLVVAYHINGHHLKAWRGSFLCAKRLLKDSWPLILSGLAIMIYMRVDKIMLGEMAGDESVGLYSVATLISEVWYFMPMAVGASVFPAIVYSRQHQSEQVYRRRMQSFYDVMAGLGYAVAIPLALIASPLVTTLFGTDYAEAGPILAVHVWAFIFVGLGQARSKWLIAENMVQFSMFTTILGAVVNVGLNYWLIPKYAGLGAAWATVISYAVAAYLSCILSARLWPVFNQLTLSLLVPFRLSSLIRSLREVL